MADTLVNTSKYWIEHFEEEAWWRGVPALFKFSGADEIKGLLILIDLATETRSCYSCLVLYLHDLIQISKLDRKTLSPWWITTAKFLQKESISKHKKEWLYFLKESLLARSKKMGVPKRPFVLLKRNTKFYSSIQTVIRFFAAKCKIVETVLKQLFVFHSEITNLQLFPNCHSIFLNTKYEIFRVLPKGSFVFWQQIKKSKVACKPYRHMTFFQRR